MSRRPRGFTFPELLAVLCIIVLLLATFVPYALALRETASRAQCTDNLRGIGIALSMYAGKNNFAYPRTRFDPAMGNRWTAFTGPDAADPFVSGSAVEANDVSASFWMLVRDELAQPFRFVCPSSDGTPDPLLDASGRPTVGRQRGNFRGPEHLTYAFASPFSAIPEYALNDTLPANFVVVADQGPSVDALATDRVPSFDAPARTLAMGNSVNHRRAGQNVLYAAGNVTFESTPYCGVGRERDREKRQVPGDNIYTALAPAPLVDAHPPHDGAGVAGAAIGPSYRYDTYLVPGANFATLAAATTRASSQPSLVPTRSTTLIVVAQPTPTSVPTTAPATTAPATAQAQ